MNLTQIGRELQGVRHQYEAARHNAASAAIEAHAAGVPIQTIATQLGVSRQAVYNWIKSANSP